MTTENDVSTPTRASTAELVGHLREPVLGFARRSNSRRLRQRPRRLSRHGGAGMLAVRRAEPDHPRLGLDGGCQWRANEMALE